MSPNHYTYVALTSDMFVTCHS